jgi:TolB protein
MPDDRRRVVSLEGVEAPNPKLQDEIDEAYYALRERLLADAGWDYLSVLEDTFLPLTSPLEPGMQDDWLYTGRAIRSNTAPLSAGWLQAIKEDYGPKTYWRLYVKARFQDGSQGVPLKDLPWDLSARHSGDPMAYERGGAYAEQIPEGYWIDLTELAAAYGWQRQPALSTWRIAYSAVRHNEFYNSGGLDWFSAMLQIYPREALNTPTPVSSPTPSATPTETSTPTETATRTPYLSRTPTATRTATATRTPRPTNTPWPTATVPPTDTPRFSTTPQPSATPTLEP